MKKLLLLSLVLALGCQMESRYEAGDLLGEWKLLVWNDITNNKTIDIDVTFQFDKEGRYIGQYGNSAEQGKYWIAADNLHTIEDGKAEKKVKIKTLNKDTLILGMNRMGSIEELVLVRE